jgi:hypothetical protein
LLGLLERSIEWAVTLLFGSRMVITLQPSSRGLPDGLSAETFRAALDRAARVWSYPAIPCTSVEISVLKPRPLRLTVEDGTNLVVMRDRSWCHNERCSHATTFPWRAAGMTTVYPTDARGAEVREGDIELNGVAFDVAKAPSLLDLVMVHEIGHVLGLSDACSVGQRPSGALQRESCAAADMDRVMYAPSRRERPSQQDIVELCESHPRRASTPVAPNGQSNHEIAYSLLGIGLVVATVIFVVRRSKLSS